MKKSQAFEQAARDLANDGMLPPGISSFDFIANERQLSRWKFAPLTIGEDWRVEYRGRFAGITTKGEWAMNAGFDRYQAARAFQHQADALKAKYLNREAQS